MEFASKSGTITGDFQQEFTEQESTASDSESKSFVLEAPAVETETEKPPITGTEWIKDIWQTKYALSF